MTDALFADDPPTASRDDVANDGAEAPPPPLSSIRVAGANPRGLNKRAIILLAGGAAALVLVLASGAFGRTGGREQAPPKPMQSAPARSEMAAGAVRDLPRSYAEAKVLADKNARTSVDAKIELGPPASGDIALFGPDGAHRAYPRGAAPGYGGPDAMSDAGLEEADRARRSGLFFALGEAVHSEASWNKASPGETSSGEASGRASAEGLPEGRIASHPDAATGPAGMSLPRSGLDDTPSIFPGTVVEASLMTGVNSEAPGPVIAQVTNTVFDSLTGRTPLIPQGARLIGTYRSASGHGQSRLAMTWSRLVMPNGAEIALDEPATDPSGAAGVAGKVDDHWLATFGAAALGTLVNISAATLGDPPQPGLVYGGIGPLSRDPVDGAIRDGVARTSDLVSSRIVDRALGVPPTIQIRAGARIAVIVTRRLSLRSWPAF